MLFNTKLIDLLKTDPRFIDDNGELVLAAAQDRIAPGRSIVPSSNSCSLIQTSKPNFLKKLKDIGFSISTLLLITFPKKTFSIIPILASRIVSA